MLVKAAVLSVFIFSIFSPLAWAHPDDRFAGPQLALAHWAEAVSSRDTARIAALSVPGSTLFDANDIDTVVTRFATFTPSDTGVTAGPVVVSVDAATFTFALEVSLVERPDGWFVAGVALTNDMPADLAPGKLPEHESTRAVAFEIVDGDGATPVFARVRITDAEGNYWPPQGHQKNVRIGWREDVGGDVVIDGKTYAYVSPRFLADLPDGTFAIEVRKGTEYLPASTTFHVGNRKSDPVRVSVHRWIDMNARGWYSGDTHTHFLDESSALLELRAEDLNMLYVLATKWGELITDTRRFTGAPSSVSVPNGVVVYNEEARHSWLGHTILHGIRELVYPLSWGGPMEGVAGGMDYPPIAQLADRTHAQGGMVTWAHFPSPGGEVAVDVALGKVDSVDLMTWGDPFAAGPPASSGRPAPSVLETWYRFLDTGAKLPATAGTDKMLNVQVVGSVKTYVNTGAKFSYADWQDAIRGGRTFATTGPILTLTANGEPIGSELALRRGAKVLVEARVEAPHGLYPVDSLEIVIGGRVAARVANSGRASTLSVSTTIAPETSTWIAARAHGSASMPYQTWPLLSTSGTPANGIPPMAHSSPIYAIVEGEPIWSNAAAIELERRVDAAIEWAKTDARYRTDAERAEVVALFEKAKAVYRQR